MGFFSTDHASNGANTRGFTPKQKREIAQLTRKVKSKEKSINAKTDKARAKKKT